MLFILPSEEVELRYHLIKMMKRIYMKAAETSQLSYAKSSLYVC